MTNPTPETLSDYCLAALLRLHRASHGPGWTSRDPNVGFEEMEEILLRWALSDQIKNLAATVAAQPRSIRSAIAFETRTCLGEITGSVDARATLLKQSLSGDPTLFVVSEPSVSPLSRRNHVLAWTLREAEALVLAGMRRHKLGAEQEWIHARSGLLESALRIRSIREVAHSPMGLRRPGASAIRDARKSLSPLYRIAAEAFLDREAIERMEPDALRRLFSSTLLAMLEDWQKLELAAALAAGLALSEVVGQPLKWKGSIAGGGEIASVGQYLIRWQNALPRRADCDLEPSELLSRKAAESLSARLGLSRADVSIRDSRNNCDIAHIECKWFSSPLSASQAISEAIGQLVRYARDSRKGNLAEAEALLLDSVIVCSSLSDFEPSFDGSKPVGLVDFEGLRGGVLRSWADRLHRRSRIALAA